MVKKRCKIHATFPLTCFSVPIIGHTELNLTTDEIYQCLCGKAEIEEVFPDGTTKHLDFTNYNKDNSVKEIKKEEPKKSEVVKVDLDEKEETLVVNDEVEPKEEVEEVIEEVSDETLVKTHQLQQPRNFPQNRKKGKNKMR